MSLEMSPCDRAHMTSYWCSIALFHVVSEIFNVEKCRDLEIGVRGHSRSSKMIQLNPAPMTLTFHSNHRPVSHRFRNKRRFPSKIANFPTPVYLTPPLKGSPWNWVSRQGSEETRMVGLPDGRKSFKIGVVILIQYRRVTVTDGQSPSQPASHIAVASNALAMSRG